MAKTPLLRLKSLLEVVPEGVAFPKVAMEEAAVALVDAMRIPLPNL
jgi:hypothetical protein